VAGDEPPHLPVALDHLGERAPIGRREPELVPHRNAGEQRRMVHRQQRRLLGRRGQLRVEPAEPLFVERAGVLAGARGVEHDETQRTEVDRVLHRLAVSSRHAEVAMQRAAVVVVAGQDVRRRLNLREQLPNLLVLGVRGVVGKIAGDEHRIRLRRQRHDSLDRCSEPSHGVAFCPYRSDVEVAELREQKRSAHDGIIHGMATMGDLDRLALAMPETTKEVSEDGRPTYLAHGKMFCFHRRPRPDAVDPATGERLDDVLVFRVGDLDAKDMLVADPRGIFFTTPHWNGYAAVLMRIPDLKQIGRDELRDLVIEAWLTRAHKRVAKAWLAENEPD
jgi:hypothetical protein